MCFGEYEKKVFLDLYYFKLDYEYLPVSVIMKLNFGSRPQCQYDPYRASGPADQLHFALTCLFSLFRLSYIYTIQIPKIFDFLPLNY